MEGRKEGNAKYEGRMREAEGRMREERDKEGKEMKTWITKEGNKRDEGWKELREERDEENKKNIKLER